MRRKGASRSAVSRILRGPKIVEVEVVNISQSVLRGVRWKMKQLESGNLYASLEV